MYIIVVNVNDINISIISLLLNVCNAIVVNLNDINKIIIIVKGINMLFEI